MTSDPTRICRSFAAVCRALSWDWLPPLILAACLIPSHTRAQTAATPQVHFFTLNYVETGSSNSVSLGNEEVKFLKEPDFSGDKVLRRALVIGPSVDDYIGFAINASRRTLYLDLNRNLDLTDDPQGVFQGNESARSYYFRDVKLSLRKDGVDRSYSLIIYVNGQTVGDVTVTSCYQGLVELQGKQWRMTVYDNLDAEINGQDRFQIVPADGGPEFLSTDSMPVPRNLFLAGGYYRLDIAYEPPVHGFSSMRVGFEEISSPTGELTLDGRFIQRLVLSGDQGAAVLDSPHQSIQLPVGKYRVQALTLQSDPAKPRLTTDVYQIPQFSVASGASYHLKAGGPLESSVAVSAWGNVLQLNYILMGVGGERYSVTSGNSRAAPTFAIYRDGRRLTSGTFEYG